jgi:Ca2+-transporting ATPase
VRSAANPLSPEATTAPAWHALAANEVLRQWDTTSRGLSPDEVQRRLARFGDNELVAYGQTEVWATLVAQFKNVLVVILLIATVASGFTGHALEAAVIAVIVLFAVVLGFVQEYRAGRALDALRRLAAPNAHVIRQGQQATIPAREVVPGDVVRLHDGDRVPADARMLTSVNLAVDESALTGESAPVRKIETALVETEVPVGERVNMVFSGTLIVNGRGTAVVVATGNATEFGTISRLVQTVTSGPTPLQQNLDRVGRSLGQVAALMVAVIAGVGLWRGAPPLEMFMFGIALAVAVVPEALPAVVTISLAIGVRRMVKRHALIRRLSTVEALGTIAVVCSDKTGTLTRNEMTVRRVCVGDRTLTVSGSGFDPAGAILEAGEPAALTADLQELLTGAVLASDARLVCREGRWLIEGDPTEGALVVAAAKAGLDQEALNQALPRIDERAFSAERRRMTTIHLADGANIAYSKGATDVVVASCSARLRGRTVVPLRDAARAQLLTAERDMAAAGLRVLAVARKQPATIGDAEHDMTFLGLIGMMDPPRQEARAAVDTCKSAGITPVMITGDHPLTARSVAAELGLLTGRVVTGHELARMSDADLTRSVDGISVYARVSPADKLRVISAWKARGAVVAMTGDGVNDAPALKKADVGIAMGITGTDVSKEAAAMTLLDDNFATIIAAIEEGRVVFANIRKYLGYLLSSNIGEIVLMATAALAGAPLPLTAVQILYVNLATDGLPALALAVDPAEDDVMKRRPRDPRRGVMTPALITLIVVGGLWAGLINYALFAGMLAARRPLEQAMATTFVSLVLMEFFKAFIYRSLRQPVHRDLLSNRWLIAAVAWELALLALVIHVPSLQRAFGTFALSAGEWLMVVGLAATIVPVLETVKWLQRREKGGCDGSADTRRSADAGLRHDRLANPERYGAPRRDARELAPRQ